MLDIIIEASAIAAVTMLIIGIIKTIEICSWINERNDKDERGRK